MRRCLGWIMVIVLFPAMIFAGDVFVAFDWTGIDPMPQYVRYQIDGQSEGNWISADATAGGMIVNVQRDSDHVVYVQASYDGILFGSASSLTIPVLVSAPALSVETKDSQAVSTAEEPVAATETSTSDKEVAVADTSADLNKAGSFISLDGSFVLYDKEGVYSKALAGSFNQDFFLKQSDFGIGYSIGAFWDKPLVFGLKLGPEIAYRIGRVHLMLGGGVMGDMDAATHNSITMSAYGEAGLRFAITKGFGIGAKFTFVYSFANFPF